jgi:hypothetical protein
MIGRFLRALRGGEPPLKSPPIEDAPLMVETQGWGAGDLAMSITGEWLGVPPPQGFPRCDTLYRVLGTSVLFSPMVGRPLLMLALEDMPGIYAAAGFEKVTLVTQPAAPAFTRDLQRISERVKARQGEL